MRLANVQGRAAVVLDGRLVDVERASGGRLPADPMALIPQLEALRDLEPTEDAPSVDEARLGPPVPRPQKVIAIGLNYKAHAEESGLSLPEEPVVFAKLPNALVGPADDIVVPAGRVRVDWEAELVVVVGRRGKRIAADQAWSHIAGVTCGQDVSDREEQFRALRQFTIAKSYDTFAPTGPVLVTPDELEDPDDLAIRCRLDGEEVQASRTSDFIFGVPYLVEWLSRHVTLEPGDLIFTGTPGGVGDSRQPPRYLTPGIVVETEIEGVGVMRNRVVVG
jgi:2-keto-4-pentenoate hydratase/2-oxohepta-3-ene-1,7-dioic acid hydratase in catechol pathway